MDKQLADQSSTPYMSLKTNSILKCKSIRFDEYKLLDTQDDM